MKKNYLIQNLNQGHQNLLLQWYVDIDIKIHSVLVMLILRTAMGTVSLVQIRIVCAPKIAFISLPINLNMCFGCSKERLIETVLLSTHNICFG